MVVIGLGNHFYIPLSHEIHFGGYLLEVDDHIYRNILKLNGIYYGCKTGQHLILSYFELYLGCEKAKKTRIWNSTCFACETGFNFLFLAQLQMESMLFSFSHRSNQCSLYVFGNLYLNYQFDCNLFNPINYY